jgi:tetratricopeptide (TPR) repeat protein
MDIIPRAKGLVHEKKYNDAMKLLQNVENDEAYFIQGVLCEENPDLGGPDAAITFYKKVKDLADAFHNYGTILIMKGQYEDAIPLFQRAIDINPSHVRALNNIAVCYEMTDDDKEKQYELFKRIIEIDKKNSFAYHNLGHLDTIHGNYRLGQLYLETAYRLNPEYPETCYTLAVLYNGFTLELPKIKPAEELLQEAQNCYAKFERKNLATLKLEEGIATSFVFNNAQIAAGRLVVGDNIIITHHNLHIPVQRWSFGNEPKKITKAWSTLQHNAWGFYHWICEVFPKIFIILTIENDPTVPIMVPNKAFVKQALKNVPGNFLYCDPRDYFFVENIKILDWPSVEVPAASKEFLPPKAVIHTLRQGIQQCFPNPSNNEKNWILWLSRNHAQGYRNVSNENQVIETLQNMISYRNSHYTILKFVPEDYSFDDTLQIFQHAKIVIGVHGGAFSNMVFSQDTSIIEFTMLEEYYRYYFKHLADCCDHPYYAIDLNLPNLFHATISLPQEKINQLSEIVEQIITPST